MQALNNAYIAHEYFNACWEPMYFSQLAGQMQTAKLDFACSAHLPDLQPRMSMSEEQIRFLAEFKDPLVAEGMRDFIVNQQFRRDYWVRGMQKLNALQKQEALAEVRLKWINPKNDMQYKFKTSLGEVSLSEQSYQPVVALLRNSRYLRYADLAAKLVGQGLNHTQIDEVLLMLLGGGYIAAVQDEAKIKAATPLCKKLNAHLMKVATTNPQIAHLVSPVTGGGVPLKRLQILFLLAAQSGQDTPQQWVEFVWEILRSQGQKLIKKGQTLESEEANKAELLENALSFDVLWKDYLQDLLRI